MIYRKTLEITSEHYEKTKKVLLTNGSKVFEHNLGSRKTLISNNEICGFLSVENNLPLSENIDSKKFYTFLGSFTKNLYLQIKKNQSLLMLKVDFNGLSRAKNHKSWSKLKSKNKFYNLDLSSAYWQMAYRLGYISKRMFDQYIDNDDYKQAKRYCISFLARDNHMLYLDNRPIDRIECDTECLKLIYKNIRHELYRTIDLIKSEIPDWIEYNIDGISVHEKDLKSCISIIEKLGLKYKLNECLKIDKLEYYFKGKIRKF